MRSVYFHEDDYCQVELLPQSAVRHGAEEMARIELFSRAQWDGHGWKELYLRDEHSHYLVAEGLTLARLEAAVGPLLTTYDEVLTGYSTYRERCQGVRAWGDSEGHCLFASVNAGGVVRALWLSNASPAPMRLDLWLDVLAAIDGLGGFVLADWSWSMMVECSDRDALRAYLRGDHDPDEPARPG